MSTSPYPADALNRLQETEREVLAVIDKLCRENGIDYFIDGGTLLGAVRHGGFIPWDDDIDIGMPKDDFDRFCEIAPGVAPERLFAAYLDQHQGVLGSLGKDIQGWHAIHR